MTADLSPNQQLALDKHWAVGDCAWFMPPGMGKTRTYLEVAKETGDEVLVFAPKLVCSTTWPAENAKWGFGLGMRFLHGRERHLHGKEQISLINPEAAGWIIDRLIEQRRPRYKTVILDELSLWKSAGAARVKAFMKIRERFEYVIGGTGTPVGASLYDLYGQMLCVDGGESLGANEDKFSGSYFHTDQYTRRREPYHDSEAAILEAIRPRAVSFDINDLNMPPLHMLPRYLDLPEAAQDAYKEMKDHSAVEELDLYAVNAAVKSGKLRQMTGGGVIDVNGGKRFLHDAKAEHLADILTEHKGRPVLVAFEFHSDYETICRVLKRQVPVLYGKTRPRDAQNWLRQWNEGKLPVLCIHPRSAGHGLNMQDSGNVFVWFTVPWSYELVNQGIARLWRQGQKNKVLAYFLLVSGSEDVRVYERCIGERAATHDRVMKGLTHRETGT